MKFKFGTALLLLLLCLVFLPQNGKSTHIMGCEASYECINACTIRVDLNCYRDCRGAPTISPFGFSFVSQTPGCGQPTPVPNPVTGVVGWPPAVVTEVTPTCPGAVTQCAGGGPTAIGGVQEFAWQQDFDICSVPNCVYTLSYSSCCRNPAITSIVNAGTAGIYIGSTTLNTGIVPCNNSPYFTNPPVPYICQGQPFTYNQGAVDPEGDSLVFSLGPCFENQGQQVTYLPGYTPTQPLGPDWNVVLNPVTGDLTVLQKQG